MHHALVIGATGGIGQHLAAILKQRRAEDTVLTRSRGGDGLDITDEGSVETFARTLEAAGIRLDLILDATGLLTVDGVAPERAFRELDPQTMATSFATNAIGPALLMKHLLPLMAKGERAVFATLSARIGSTGDNHLGGWMSYRASKAALNQLVRCASIEVQRKQPQHVVVALHPGTIETELSRPYARGRFTMSASDAAGKLLDVLDGLGPEDSGWQYDYSGARIVP